MISTEHYWTFNFKPFIFQVQNLNFSWLTNWWYVLLLVLIYGGGFIVWSKSRKNLLSKLKPFPILNTKAKIEALSVILTYSLGILILLFALHHMHIAWGLRWYSTMYLIGFIAVFLSCQYWIQKKSLMLTDNSLVSLIIYCIIGMLIGARLTYVLVYNFDYYKMHPLEIFATWEGGLAFHGGIMGVSIAILIFCKRYKVPFFHLTDKICRIVPIGIGLGRIGNFMNGELWGREISSHVPWAIIFPEAGSIPRHPSQIYQSLGEGWGLFLTLFIISRWKQKEGTLSACFIIFYTFYRFIIEYFRAADIQVSYLYLDKMTWAPLNFYTNTTWWQIITMGQLLCLIFMLLGFILLYFTRKNIQENSTAWLKRNHEFFLKNFKKESNS